MEKIKVLLVDDHPLVCQGMRTILGAVPDIEVVAEAYGGSDAIEKVDEYRPDVVMMDFRMPDINGLEATRTIKSRHPRISVIVLSMFDDEAYVINAVKAGASGYLLKDASEELIINTVRAANNGSMPESLGKMAHNGNTQRFKQKKTHISSKFTELE